MTVIYRDVCNGETKCASFLMASNGYIAHNKNKPLHTTLRMNLGLLSYECGQD